MFEQTFLNKPSNARKPYSIVLSLILQIIVIGVLCLVPFVYPQVLPTMRLKSLVLAAPPKPPVAVKMMAAEHAMTALPRSFILIHGPLLVRAAVASSLQAEIAAPSVDGAETGAGVPYGVGSAMPEPLPPTPAVAKPKVEGQRPIRVGTISGANLIHLVQPTYPPLARASRIQGTVEFTATISREGTIENLTLLHGHPLLINAAREAVLQWRYRPTLLSGEPVEVITDIVVNFRLNQ